jgi:phosphonate transport system permease protein
MTDATVAEVPIVARKWRRFTFAQRLTRFVVYLAVVAAIVASVRTIEVIPEFLYDAPEQVVDLFTRMWPIDWPHYQETVHAALMETIHIASLGTLLALVLALPVGILAAHNLVRFTPLNLLAKLILVSSRSVNSLVWALLFVGIFGPGALAGTLAIAFRSNGFVGK